MLYPIMTSSRLVSDLSGVWDFKLVNSKGFEEKWYEKPLEDPMTMPVPLFLQRSEGRGRFQGLLRLGLLPEDLFPAEVH